MTPKAIHWYEPSSQEEDSADEFETPAQSTFNPKKRWLREAWHDDLAKPLEPPANSPKVPNCKPVHGAHQSLMASPPKQPLSIRNEYNAIDKCPMNPNQLRPTVLMVASKDRTMPMQSNAASPKTSRSYLTSSPLSSTTANIITVFDSQLHTRTDTHLSGDRSIVVGPGLQLPQPPPIASHTPTTPDSQRTFQPSSNDRVNRKWLSALALMELAADENSPVSSTMPLTFEHSTTN